MENDKIFHDFKKEDFKDEDVSILKTEKGLNEDIVSNISSYKNEPEKMKQYRLKALKEFYSHHNPSFGPDLSFLDFNDFTYFTRMTDKVAANWNDVPEALKNTFDKLGIPEAEQQYLAGVTTQYESEAVYHNMLDEVKEKGIIFLDTDTEIGRAHV